jgi:hypothetical protein
MSTLIPFDEIVVGQEFDPYPYEVTEEVVREYCHDWDDQNPWYSHSSPFGYPVAPPAVMAGLTGFRLLGSKFQARATIGAQTAHKNLGPLRVGQTMITKGRIIDKYIKRGLEYVVIASTSYDESGTPIRESTDHILLSMERVTE